MSMFGNAFGGPGSWYISSEKDPRFNKSGTSDFISGLMGPSDDVIENTIKKLEEKFGTKPDDLTVGWMKD